MDPEGNFKRGTVELVLLSLLQEKDMYGYQMSQEINQRGGKQFYVQEAAKYTILYRLEEKGYISSYSQPVDKRPRIYYHLEPKGETYLQNMRKSYFAATKAVFGILRTVGKGLTDEDDIFKDQP